MTQHKNAGASSWQIAQNFGDQMKDLEIKTNDNYIENS